MRQLIIASLPTVILNKIKIVNILYLDFCNNNLLSGSYQETTYTSPLFILENGLLYLLQNRENPNIDLLVDSFTEEIFYIAKNYYDLISEETKMSDDIDNFKINESTIKHEIRQLFNDICLIYEIYCKHKKILGIELSCPDKIHLETTS